MQEQAALARAQVVGFPVAFLGTPFCCLAVGLLGPALLCLLGPFFARALLAGTLNVRHWTRLAPFPRLAENWIRLPLTLGVIGLISCTLCVLAQDIPIGTVFLAPRAALGRSPNPFHALGRGLAELARAMRLLEPPEVAVQLRDKAPLLAPKTSSSLLAMH
jgi:hypothetical protein